MKSSLLAAVVSRGVLRSVHGLLAAAALLGALSDLAAQSVLFDTPKAILTPKIIQQDTAPDAASSDVLAGPDTGSPLALGQIKIHPQLLLRYMQANGLPAPGGLAKDSRVFTFAPGLTVDLGQNWILNYTPTWINYSESTLTDSTSQSANIVGATKVNDWTFGFSENFQSSQDILAETATQTKQHTWDTELSASRKVGQRSKYDGTLKLDEFYTDVFPDSKTWSTAHWLRMQVTQKLNAGLGVNLSKTDIHNSADMHAEEYMGSIRWQTTEKIDFSAQGGLEIRHFDTAGVGSLRSPTLQLSLNYRPFEHTRFTLASTRSVSSSFFTNEVTRNSGWTVSLNQRLLEKLNLSMSYNEQTNDYRSFATAALTQVRSDDFKSFNTSLGVKLLKHWILSAVYQSTKNSSDQAGFGFSTTQYGVELSGAY